MPNGNTETSVNKALARYLPYLALVSSLIGGGIAWGQNEQRISTLEEKAPQWVHIKIEQAKIRERVKHINERQLRMDSKLDNIYKAIREQRK